MSSEVEFELDRALRRAILLLRGFAAIFSIEVAAPTTARSTHLLCGRCARFEYK